MTATITWLFLYYTLTLITKSAPNQCRTSLGAVHSERPLYSGPGILIRKPFFNRQSIATRIARSTGESPDSESVRFNSPRSKSGGWAMNLGLTPL